MTTANKITIARVALIPVFLVLAYTGHMYWALAVYIIACLSDMADGYIARHYNQISNFGKFADPLADKMLVLSAMCFFVENGQMPAGSLRWCFSVNLRYPACGSSPWSGAGSSPRPGPARLKPAAPCGPGRDDAVPRAEFG